jgi:hypothetical protein
MPVRKTESRLNENFIVGDYGQAVVNSGNTIALISYHTSPVAVSRKQTYIIFILDSALQAAVEKYEWTTPAGNIHTEYGIFEYTPETEGIINLKVNILGNGGIVLESLQLDQTVVYLNVELESLITDETQAGAAASDPETSREIINDIAIYIDWLASREDQDSYLLNKLIFALAYAEALMTPQADREKKNENLSLALENGEDNYFIEGAAGGIGITQLRPQIVAMYTTKTMGANDWLIDRKEFPADINERESIGGGLKQDFLSLEEKWKIDLFNLLRFPKTNLRIAKEMLENLMEQYFPGLTISEIFNDQTKAVSLINQFKQGPFSTS